DFLTLATHELGHAVGLGESADPGSVMYEYLSPGAARRTFTDSNLSLINTDADRFMKADAHALAPAAPALPAGEDDAPPVSSVTWAAPLATAGPAGAGSFAAPRPAGTAYAGGGDDVLVGGSGADLIVGGDGRDVLVGGF